MSIDNRLTVPELGNISDPEETALGNIALAELSPLETTLGEEFNELAEWRSFMGKLYLAAEGVGTILTAAAIAIPLTFIPNKELGEMIALWAGASIGLTTAIMGVLGYPAFKNNRAVKSQKKKAQKLDEEGYVFAHQLKDSILLPSSVGEVDHVLFRSLGFDENISRAAWYAVKEQYTSASAIPLSEIGKYVGETVIVPVQVTAVGSYSDMKLSARGEFSGTVMGMIPLQMSGTIEGRVFTEEVSFRIGDSKGNTIPAYLGYLAPHLKEQLPLQLRAYSPVTKNVSIVDKTQVVNFLNEAQNNKRKLIALGKLDSAGNFNMEALADAGSKQAYALAVYQPK